jgi:4-hydroxy-3-polyprenylbenzoate decarboxylase
MNKIIIGITGASGSVYAKQLLNRLLAFGEIPEIAVVFSEEGKKVWDFELKEERLINDRIRIFDSKDFFAPVASGSANYNAMVVIPCSMGTMGRIAAGTSDNLIIRAADVMLKEKRKLVLVPREMPYNLIHIRNMETLLLAGAQLIPASPSFYSHPKTIDDVIKTVTDKVLSALGYNDGLYEWGKQKGE